MFVGVDSVTARASYGHHRCHADSSGHGLSTLRNHGAPGGRALIVHLQRGRRLRSMVDLIVVLDVLELVD